MIKKFTDWLFGVPAPAPSKFVAKVSELMLTERIRPIAEPKPMRPRHCYLGGTSSYGIGDLIVTKHTHDNMDSLSFSYDVRIDGVKLQIPQEEAWSCYQHIVDCYDRQLHAIVKTQRLEQEKEEAIKLASIKDKVTEWGLDD
jgi:hypothetical protein